MEKVDKVTRMKRTDLPMISQQELQLLKTSWQKRRELMSLEQRLSERILKQLEAGASVEPGPYHARIRVVHVSTKRVHHLIVR